MARVLGVEENHAYHNILSRALGAEHLLTLCSSMSSLGQKTGKTAYDVAVLSLDVNGNGAEDLEPIQKIQEQLGQAPVIVTSEKDDSDWIVRVIRAGAHDFIAKPYSGEKIRLAVDSALEKRSMKNEIDYLRRQQDVIYDLDRIVASTPAMQDILSWTRKYAQTESNLLLTGETGTGKSFLAGAVHFNSPRKKRPFIKINCANLPENLLESELFGHEKGAFTDATQTRVGRLEQAAGGTVFLDEIGEMTPALQAKFLQVVEEKNFQRLGGNRTIYSDIRIIVATNRNLEQMMEASDFRSDLYYRLNILKLHLPPLRERKQCIEPLTRMLLERICRQLRKKMMDISPEALEILGAYHWPGNIRELSNVLERAILLEHSDVITAESIHLNSGLHLQENSYQNSPSASRLENTEYRSIIQALEDNLWVQKHAAAQLGISPRSLNYKIKKLGITHWRWPRHKDK
ncbi:two component, sigma54 specific, transcriptional regulator, Fis family [Desulfonatronospira thiodismutans ASO3-1]|uniref:Two component, sigma54 specific, transcriptional regulator, Fis family n=1 Tax=Desulfonatronospira thiodismutans ASO3-1 TaxID=555779 RepID=D6SUF7_9BACT|nr:MULTISPECIES: sigma-54 dependent transcriptional regulator [Desulfonatronospira]EFI32937.1 two component, sigma54 specific, transcriptional regulator, Fis family [Desulfonatronospira thiodismutans ASO3-1]RQD76452.1 MAG: sigma-54-dependent Fis family transcriptional regulator [Desulfonatronospira sp. MSAO_Bac3]